MSYTVVHMLAKSNIETIRVNNLFLHSKFNPILEAENFVKDKYSPHQLHVVFGYGLGYIIDSLIKLFHFNEPVLVIDPLLDANIVEMKNHKYDRIYYANANNDAQIIDLLDKLASYTTKVQFISSINYDKLFPNEMKKVIEYIHLNQYKQGANITTAKRYAKEWQRNLLFNTYSLKEDYSLEKLKGKYDVPIVIASGGPSLIKQLDLIKQNRDKLILICAGSTINALVNNNITPDYVVSVDGGEPNARHFENLHLDENVSLIYAPTNHYKVRNAFSGSCFGFVPTIREKLNKYFSKRIHKKLPLIDGGGSVAHFAYAVAKYISNGPIAFIGQDLAYTNNESHAEGVKGNHKVSQYTDLVFVEGYHGEEIATSPAMRIMLNTFNEAPLYDPTRKNVWNCTEGGAKIQTIPQLAFKDFLTEFANNIVEKIELEKYEWQFDEKVTYSIKEELNGYKVILDLFNQGINIVNTSPNPLFTSSELNRLKKIEGQLNELFKTFSLETLLEPVFDRCMKEYLPSVNETDVQAHTRTKKYTLDLYTSSKNELDSFINDIYSGELVNVNSI